LMSVGVEVVLADDLEHGVDAGVVAKHAAEDALLGLAVLRRQAVQQLFLGGHDNLRVIGSRAILASVRAGERGAWAPCWPTNQGAYAPRSPGSLGLRRGDDGDLDLGLDVEAQRQLDGVQAGLLDVMTAFEDDHFRLDRQVLRLQAL